MTYTLFRSILSGMLLVFLLCGTVAATDLLITVQDSQNADPVPQASIYVDGTNIGQTTSSGTFLLTHEKEEDFSLRIIKNGYEEWSATVNPDLSFLEITLSRLTQVLTVQVYDADSLSPVTGAVVNLSFGIDSATKTSDGSGRVTFPVSSDTFYAITISAPGYRTISSEIVAGKPGGVAVQYWLVSNDRFSFFVTDDTGAGIEGATIYLDGERAGTTDGRGALVLTVPRNLLYAIEVKKEGYLDYLEYRTIGDGEAVLEIAMAHGQTSEAASLTIAVIDRDQKPVAGAGLSLNGKDIGFSDNRGQIATTVPYDTPVMITARKDGYSTTSVETTAIAGNATPALTVTLDRAPDWGFIALVILGIAIILVVIVGISRRRRPARHIVRRNEI